MGVDHRHLAPGAGPGERELAARRRVAEKQICCGLAAPGAWIPHVEDRRYLYRTRADPAGRPFMPATRPAFPSRRPPGAAPAGAPVTRGRTATPPRRCSCCRSPRTTITASATPREVDGAWSSALLVEPLGRVDGGSRYIGRTARETCPSGKGPRACSTRDPAPTRRGHRRAGRRSRRDRSRRPRAEGLARRVRQGAETARELSVGIEGEQPVIVAQEHGGAFGGHSGVLALCTLREDLVGTFFSTTGLEQAYRGSSPSALVGRRCRPPGRSPHPTPAPRGGGRRPGRAISMSRPGADATGRGISQVGGEAVGREAAPRWSRSPRSPRTPRRRAAPR